MPTKGRETKLQDFEKEDIVMDSNLPEEIKSKLLRVLRDERVAAQIITDCNLPDLTPCGLYVATIEGHLNPVMEEAEEIIQQLRNTGINLPQEDTALEKTNIYFVGKDPAIVELLERSFYSGNHALIRDITAAPAPSSQTGMH
jgi:hypothetical protein